MTIKTPTRRQSIIYRPGTTTLFTALLLLWCIVAVHPSAIATPLVAPTQQATDFSWSPSGGTIATPAGRVNVPFSATLINGGVRDAFLIHVNLPSGWSVSIAPSSAVDIAQNSSQAIGFFVSIPNSAAPGNYTVLITASRLSNNSNALLVLTAKVTSFNPCTASQMMSTGTTIWPGSHSIRDRIIIQQVTDFYWDPLGSTLNAHPGDINIQFLANLHNKGPSDVFNIQISLPEGWTALITPSSAVSIAQNSSQQIGFFISIPANAKSGSYTAIITASRISNQTPSLAVLTVRLPSNGCTMYLPFVHR